jgi:hypothetical protein
MKEEGCAECGHVSRGAEHPDASVEGLPSETFNTGSDPTAKGTRPAHTYGHARSLVGGQRFVPHTQDAMGTAHLGGLSFGLRLCTSIDVENKLGWDESDE